MKHLSIFYDKYKDLPTLGHALSTAQLVAVGKRVIMVTRFLIDFQLLEYLLKLYLYVVLKVLLVHKLFFELFNNDHGSV